MQNLNEFQQQQGNGQPQYSQMSPDQVMESLKHQQQQMIDENEYQQQQQQHYTGQQSMGQHSLNTGDMQNISKEQKSIGTTRKWMWAYPQIEGVPPCPRGGHSSTLTGASLVIFGGHYYSGKETGYVYLNDTHVLDVNASRWIKPKISGTPPPARYGHTSVLAGSRIIIFGGKGQKNLVFRDLHALDPVSMTWYQGPEGGGAPTARFNHSANLVGGTKMLVFGGWNGKQFFNDLYVLDLEIMAWTKPNTSGHAPTPRKGHCAILIGANLVIHGGFCFDEDKQKQAGIKQGSALRQCYYNDIRVLDTETYSWSRLRVSGTPPQPRFSHTMDISNADILMFGGWTLQSGMRSKHEATSENCEYFLVWSTQTMNWERGKYVGTPPTSRFGHTSTAIGPHLLIFGGWELTKAQNQIIVLRECTSQAPSQNQSQQQPAGGNSYEEQLME